MAPKGGPSKQQQYQLLGNIGFHSVGISKTLTTLQGFTIATRAAAHPYLVSLQPSVLLMPLRVHTLSREALWLARDGCAGDPAHASPPCSTQWSARTPFRRKKDINAPRPSPQEARLGEVSQLQQAKCEQTGHIKMGLRRRTKCHRLVWAGAPAWIRKQLFRPKDAARDRHPRGSPTLFRPRPPTRSTLLHPQLVATALPQ